MSDTQEDVRTNPDTCLHNVIIARVGKVSPKVHVILHCVSCETDISHKADILKRKNYQYDLNHHVWVHIPVQRKTKK